MSAGGYQFVRRERALEANVDVDLPLLALSEEAVEFIAQFLRDVPVDDQASWTSAELNRRVAAYQILVLAVRSCAAQNALLRIGYEAEAMALGRRVAECLHRARSISDDASGERARQWLARQETKPTKLATKYGGEKLFSHLSVAAHADALGVVYLYNPPYYIDVPAEQRGLNVTPFRLFGLADELLYAGASNLIMLGAVLAEVYGIGMLVPGTLHDGLLWAADHMAEQRARHPSPP